MRALGKKEALKPDVITEPTIFLIIYLHNNSCSIIFNLPLILIKCRTQTQ